MCCVSFMHSPLMLRVLRHEERVTSIRKEYLLDFVFKWKLWQGCYMWLIFLNWTLEQVWKCFNLKILSWSDSLSLIFPFHIRLFSGSVLCSVLRSDPWQYSGNRIWYQRFKASAMICKAGPSLLLSFQPQLIIFKAI